MSTATISRAENILGADTNTSDAGTTAQYSTLASILDEAHAQASIGKGAERHGDGQPWGKQPIMTITLRYGIGFPLGQAEKKMSEAAGMINRGEAARSRAELLGAIVYLAAAIHHLDTQIIPETQKERPPEKTISPKEKSDDFWKHYHEHRTQKPRTHEPRT